MKRHYNPQFHLKQFKADRLYELNLTTGKCEPRKLDKAGQHEDFYPHDLETGLLKRLDNDASRVFRYRILGNRRDIILDPEERRTLSLWLACYITRTPYTLEDFKAHTENSKRNPQQAVDIVYEKPEQMLAILKAKSPDNWAELMSNFGEFVGREIALAAVVGWIKHGKVDYFSRLNPKEMFHDYIEEERIKRYAEALCNRRWTFFRSGQGFIVGDQSILPMESKAEPMELRDCTTRLRDNDSAHGVPYPSDAEDRAGLCSRSGVRTDTYPALQ